MAVAQREKVILEAEDRASREFRKAEGGFEKFSGKLKQLATAGGLAIAAKKVLELGANTVRMAIDAEEAASAFATTFGPSVGRVNTFVDEFANKAGFATFELQQMLAVTGNVVQGLGATEEESAALSEKMATLAGDVASFSNASGGAEAVLAALQSATTGEREALKTYGIVLSEAEVQQAAFNATGKRAADELSRLDKALATVDLAYEKANKSVGDLDRTQDSAANALRRLNALWKEGQVEIGERLVPKLEEMIPVLERLIPMLVDVGSAMADLTAFAVDVGISVAAFFGSASAQEAQVLGGTLDFVRERMEAGANASGVLEGALRNLIDRQQAYPRNIQAVIKELGASNEVTAEAVRRTLEYTRTIGGTELQLQTLEEELAKQVLAMDLTESELRVLLDTFGIFDAAVAVNVESQGDLAERLGITIDTLDASDRAMLNSGIRLGAITEETAEFEGRTLDMTDALRQAAFAQESLSSVLLAAADPVFGAVDAFGRYQDTLEKYDELVASGEASTQELVTAQLDIAEAALKAQAGLDGISDEQLTQAAESIALALGLDIAAVEELLNQLGLLDGARFTTIVDVQLGRVPSPRQFIPTGFTVTGGGQVFGHRGGIVPDLNAGRDVLARLEPGEEIIPKPAAATGTASGGPPAVIMLMLDGRVLGRAVIPHVVGEIEVNIGRWR